MIYEYQKDSVDAGKLLVEFTDVGIPVAIGGVSWDVATQRIILTTDRNLTAQEEIVVSNIITAHDSRPKHKRTIFSIRVELNALSAAKKNAVWNDINSGNPPKWSLDAGPNAAAIAAIEFSATSVAGITAAEKTEARLRLVAMYIQDNPKYLVNPSFDPTINVPGNEV